MKGKVKIIKRSTWYVGNQAFQHCHDIHDVRYTCLYAVTYDGHNVEIDEKDVLRHFDRQRFSENLVAELDIQMHNKLIEYDENEDGDYQLKGSISLYI